MNILNSVVVLVPVGGRPIEPGCEAGLQELERLGFTVRRVSGYAAIDAARSQMATDALAHGFNELVWIDADVLFRPADVVRLREHNLPFACGLYAKKNRREMAATFLPGTEAVRFGRGGGLVEVAYCGFGFVYTRREVYEAVRESSKLPTCNQRFGHPLVPYFAPMAVPDGDGSWYLGEDYAFCERARRAGFKLMADTSIRLWHVGDHRFGWEDAAEPPKRSAVFTLRVGTTPPNRPTGENAPPP